MNSKIYCKPPFSCRKFAQAKKRKIASYAQEFLFVCTRKKRRTKDEGRKTAWRVALGGMNNNLK